MNIDLWGTCGEFTTSANRPNPAVFHLSTGAFVRQDAARSILACGRAGGHRLIFLFA
jgi:hypothetical protein